MNYTTVPAWGPTSTPKVIKGLILATALCSILSALLEPFFNELFGWRGLQFWLSLSWYGIQKGCVWQLLSYLFVQETGSQGIGLSFLIILTFNMYLLWVMGTAVLEAVGTQPFLRLYFLSGLFAALLTLLIMRSSDHYEVLSGAFPAIFAVLTVWTLLNPEVQVLLFFVIPVKAKWILAAILGATFLIDLSQRAWIDLVFYLSGGFFGYFYGAIAWGLRSPWALTRSLDLFLNKLGQKGTGIGKAKIFDFKTGKEVLNDDQFVDAMLAKIYKKGENSLTFQERQRMDEIAKRRRK